MFCKGGATHDACRKDNAKLKLWNWWGWCNQWCIVLSVSQYSKHHRWKEATSRGTVAENVDSTTRWSTWSPQNCHKRMAKKHNKAICCFQLIHTQLGCPKRNFWQFVLAWSWVGQSSLASGTRLHQSLALKNIPQVKRKKGPWWLVN